MPTSTTPNMSLVLPTPSAELGPLWATELNAAFSLADSHDHAPGKGVRVTPAGLSINADLPIGNNNLTGVRSVRLQDQGGAISAVGDLGVLYRNGNNLWFRDGAGAQIQLTPIGTTISTTWGRRLISAATTMDPAWTEVFIDIDTAGPRTLTLPAANAVVAGRYFVLSDRTGQAGTNAITLTPAGADLLDGLAASQTMITNFDTWIIVSDGTSRWRTIRSQRELAGAAREGLLRMTTDFGGTGASPTVVQLTGASSIVTLGPTPTTAFSLERPSAGGGVGGSLTIRGADGVGGGGPLILQSGTDGTTGEGASGDLRFRRGTRTAMLISGSSSTITWSCPMSTASGSGTDLVVQAQSGVTSGRGGDITILAGNATTSGRGGEVGIRSGTALGAGVFSGSVYLSLGGAARLVQLVQLSGGVKIVGLALDAALTATEMPSGTGDGVVYLANAAVAPTVTPVGGTIVSSESGVGTLRGASGDAAIGLGGTTYGTANIGGVAIPATCSGFFTVVINGTPRRVPFFAT